MATTLAILYVIIIALAGLGIVVVKALGGEEVADEGRDRGWISRPSSFDQHGLGARRPATLVYDVPAESTYVYGDKARRVDGYS